MSLQKLLNYLYSNPMIASIQGNPISTYPWMLLADLMLDPVFQNIGEEELIQLIDVASEKGYVQIDWKIPFSYSAIKLLEPGFTLAEYEERPRIGF